MENECNICIHCIIDNVNLKVYSLQILFFFYQTCKYTLYLLYSNYIVLHIYRKYLFYISYGW